MRLVAALLTALALALMVWSAKNSRGGAYQKHNPHPSHFLSYLSYAVAFAAWGTTIHLETGRAAPLLLFGFSVFHIRKSILAYRAWRMHDPIEF